MPNVNITFQVNEKETASIKYHLSKYLEVEPEDMEVFNQVGAESIDGRKIDVQIVKDYKFAPVFDNCRNISLFSLYYGQTKDSSVGKIDSIIEMCSANDLGTVKLGADLLYSYSCHTNEENIIKFIVLNSLSLSNKVGEQIPLFILLWKNMERPDMLLDCVTGKYHSEMLDKVMNAFVKKKVDV